MKQLVTALLIITNTLAMNAQQSQKVDLKQLGLSFEIPEGWTGKMESDYILLGHHTIVGFMALFQNNEKSLEALKSSAEQGINEAGVSLQLQKEVVVKSKTQVEATYQGTYQGSNVKAYAIGLLNNNGRGMTILILTEIDKFTDTHITEAQKLASTVTFYESVDSEWVTFWKQRLAGSQYKYLYSSYDEDYIGGTTSSSETIIINFCSDGRFKYYYNQMTTLDTDDAAGHQALNDDSTGTYEIYGHGDEVWVDLNFNSGKTNSYELSTDSKKQKTLLNGVRYYNTGYEASCD